MNEPEIESMTIQETVRLTEWLRAAGTSDADILDCQRYIATGVALPAGAGNRNGAGRSSNYDFEGMTDAQYKGLLLDMRKDWREALELAVSAGNVEIQKKVEAQIAKIDQKLRF